MSMFPCVSCSCDVGQQQCIASACWVVFRNRHGDAGAGHVRAAAATAIAFLACHPIGAKGDECMWGPYREALLEAGALRVLLEAALAPTQDEVCRKVIEKAAAVGVMYLCTVVSLPSSAALLVVFGVHSVVQAEGEFCAVVCCPVPVLCCTVLCGPGVISHSRKCIT